MLHYANAVAPVITLEEYIELRPSITESGKERFGQYPIAIKQTMPDISRKALRDEIKGKGHHVKAQMLIDEDGKVTEVTILDSTDERLNSIVIRALKRWKFARPESMSIEQFTSPVIQQIRF